MFGGVKTKKTSIIVVFALLCALVLTSCAKTVSEETIEVNAIIVEKDYDAAYTTVQPILIGKTVVPTTKYHPADWDICIEYDGVTIEWDVDEETYNQYNIGDSIKCHLTTIKYDTGEIKIKLQAIE